MFACVCVCVCVWACVRIHVCAFVCVSLSLSVKCVMLCVCGCVRVDMCADVCFIARNGRCDETAGPVCTECHVLLGAQTPNLQRCFRREKARGLLERVLASPVVASPLAVSSSFFAAECPTCRLVDDDRALLFSQDMTKFTLEDFELVGFNPHPRISMEMAV